MQKFSRSLLLTGVLAFTGVLAGCGDDVTVEPPPVVVTISGQPSTAISVGDKVQLSASVPVTWATSNAAVATVSGTGLVTAVAGGVATITGTSTTDATKSGSVTITVNAVSKGVQSVSVAPGSATIAPGDKLQLVANVARNPGVAGTVTWASSNTAAATVDNAGVVTAVANGTASITATSTVDNTVSGAAAITVASVPATVSIKTITQNVNGLLAPVDVSNVFGQIDVTLNIDPGSQQLQKVAVLVDGVEVNSQTFGSETPGSDISAAFAPTEVTIPIPTNKFDATTGKPSFLNGNHKITAVVTTKSGAGTTNNAQTAIDVTFRNVSGFMGKLTNSGNSANDGLGLGWKSGDLTVTALPVLYGNLAAPFTVPTVASATINFGSGCDASGTGTRSKAAAASGANWTTTFTGTTASVGATPNNVNRYELNAAACPGTQTTVGEVPTIIAVGTDGNAIQAVNGGFLNSPLLAAISGIVPDATFAVRLDNRPPQPTPPVYNTNTTSPVIRTANWINDALVLNAAASNATFQTAPFTTEVDLGVSRVTNGAPIVYESRIGLTSAGNTAIDATAAVTSASGQAESSANNTYTIRAIAKDALGNATAAQTQTAGVDRTTPVLAVAGGVAANGAVTGAGTLIAQFVAFAATDTASGGATPSGFFNLAGTPLLTEVRRITPTTNTFFCPSAVPVDKFVTTTTGCATAPGWVTAQSFQGPLTQTFAVVGAGDVEAYYQVTSAVDDQAGNQSASVGRTFIYDHTVPAVGGITFPAFLNGGQAVTFSTQANDNLDLGASTWLLNYPAFAQSFQFPDVTLGTFGFDVFTTTASPALTTTFIRNLQQGSPAPAAPVGNAAFPTSVNVVVSDVAGNLVTPAVTPINPASIPLTTPSTNFSAGGGFTWTLGITAPTTLPTVVGRDDPAAAVKTVTFAAAATGPTGTFQNPFTSRVEFWVQVAGGTWRRIGQSTSPTVTDNGVNRVWTFSITWDPDAYTAPVVGAATVIAIGVNANGDALATPNNAGNITIAIP